MSRRKNRRQQRDSRHEADTGDEPVDAPILPREQPSAGKNVAKDQPDEKASAGEDVAKDQPDEDTAGSSGQGDEQARPADQAVKTHGWEDAPVKVRQRAFPSPGPKDEPLRIAMTAAATAEVSAHAKASLDEEVCGVLLGEVCRDEQGVWVSAKAAVRGTSAKRGGTHVTYTQETWEKIYEVKDRDYPKLSIVGWYHSHPGFGVEFSDMDKFIQRNFFSGPTQFALVVDPLGGDEAICVCSDDDVRYVARYWIDGRERTCRVPHPQDDAGSAVVAGGGLSAGVEKRLKNVEERLQQLLQAREDDRAARHGFRLMLGCLAAAAFIVWVGLGMYDRLWGLPYLPESQGTDWKPVEIEGEDVLLGIELTKWRMPPKWKAEFLRQQRKQFDAEKKQTVEQVKSHYEEQIKKILEAIRRQQQEAEAAAEKKDTGKDKAEP